MANILIIDDDPQIGNVLNHLFTRMEHSTEHALTLKKGLARVFTDNFDIVFLDVHLPDGNGLDAIKHIRNRSMPPQVIIITGDGDPESAGLAMRSKAWDYIQKSSSHKEFKFSLLRALEYRKQKLAMRQSQPITRDGIIGQSRPVLNCLDQVSLAANNDLPVLITGETGTGKELFSRAIHNNSYPSRANFVVVDCTSLPEHLVESMLFGHTRGAFTGADSDKVGLIKMADQGTLFLDEIGELPLGIQKKFLRALQEGRFRPVGSKKEVTSDFRLISATHRDLIRMVAEDQFREDFFFRLFSIHIQLPPLRNRENDAKLIALNHIKRKSDINKTAPCTMSEHFLEELRTYEWPGNVRELVNTIDSVCSKSGYGSTLFPHHLPEEIRVSNIKKKFQPKKNKTVQPPDHQPTLKTHLEQEKYAYLRDLFSATRGDIKEACQISGLSRSQLYRLINQYQLNDN